MLNLKSFIVFPPSIFSKTYILTDKSRSPTIQNITSEISTALQILSDDEVFLYSW